MKRHLVNVPRVVMACIHMWKNPLVFQKLMGDKLRKTTLLPLTQWNSFSRAQSQLWLDWTIGCRQKRSVSLMRSWFELFACSPWPLSTAYLSSVYFPWLTEQMTEGHKERKLVPEPWLLKPDLCGIMPRAHHKAVSSPVSVSFQVGECGHYGYFLIKTSIVNLS